MRTTAMTRRRSGFGMIFCITRSRLPLDQRAIPIQPLLRAEGWAAFEEWDRKPDKITY